MDPNRRSNCDEPAPPGTSPLTFPNTPTPLASAKGVENAKKRLRAFSIQKKTTPLTPIVPKPISTGTTTVLIGKLSGVKPSPKIEEDLLKKLPKPPKPGAARKSYQESYSEQQRRTLSEIEDMKRKMELVDLGIPLGLICPSSTDEKAMPTKAMPPIKTFLDPAKVDELIREAKKARVEGREFKFDYQKILPDYDNPFQRKREDTEKEYKYLRRRSFSEKRNRKSDKYHFGRYSKEEREIRKHKEEEKYKERDKEKSKDRSKPIKEETSTQKETDVNLKDFFVCDSWSENDDKATSTSPALRREDMSNDSVGKTPERKDDGFKKEKEKGTDKIVINISKEPSQYFKECLSKKVEVETEPIGDSPKDKPSAADKLQPVLDCFKFEIDPNEDEILDIFDEESSLEKYSQPKHKTSSFYVSPGKASFESTSRDMSMDGMNDDTFLESVINEIRQDDHLCDETSEDKRLVEYDESPNKDDYDSPVPKGKERKRASVTPEMDEKMIEQTRLKHELDKQESLKQKNHDLDGKEPINVSSDYSDINEQGSQSSPSNEYSDIKEQATVKSDYSDKRDQRSRSSQRRGYSDKKDSSSKKKYYTDKKDVSQRSSYSDGRQSTESGYKTSDTNKSESNKYVDNFRLSVEKELDEALERSMNRSTVESLETWSFVLKICQPLLFRHDKNKCFRETTIVPKIWYTENPKMCTCVKDRAIVYEELEMLKMGLVDRVYGCDQLTDTPSVNARAWYPRASACLAEGHVQPVAVDWEADDSQTGQAPTPQREDEIMLDREYQRSVHERTNEHVRHRFMEAVWPDVAEAKAPETSRSTTPVRPDARLNKKEEDAEREAEDKKTKKIKLSSEGWSQESDIEEEPEPEKTKRIKIKDKEKSRKRKRSSSTLSSVSDSDGSSKKKRKMMKKKKALKKAKSKEAKRRRMGKKLLKKLKEKQKQKKKIGKEESDELDIEEVAVKKKELKKKKKKKQQKLKKKSQKRRRKTSSTTDFTTTTSSGTDSECTRTSKSKKRKRTESKKKKRDKRKKSSSESQSEDLFDVNILNNIKTERLTDDEKCQKMMEFSPRIHHKPREIINVKELQNDFVGNIIHIKQEVKDPIQEVPRAEVKEPSAGVKDLPGIEESVEKKVIDEDTLTRWDEREQTVTKLEKYDFIPMPVSPPMVEEVEKMEIKEAQDMVMSAVPMRVVDESNLSQSSSQESICSVKETSTYEKDESHLRPSSQNSNYSFNDVIASQSALYHKSIETIVDSQDKYGEGYDHETGDYEIYEQLAMAYQSDVASLTSRRDSYGAGGVTPQRIETVVRVRARGEIKCDWRADHTPAAPPANRPSRWGLKPSEVNIVLTGGEQDAPPVLPAAVPVAFPVAVPAPLPVAVPAPLPAAVPAPLPAAVPAPLPVAVPAPLPAAVPAPLPAAVPAPLPAAVPAPLPAAVPAPLPAAVPAPLPAAVPAPLPAAVPAVLPPQPVYRIQSLAKRTEIAADYDEAYMDMYGASDRLQYGDCFANEGGNVVHMVPPPSATDIAMVPMPLAPVKATSESRSTLDARIDLALREAALNEMLAAAKAADEQREPEKGILVTAVGGSAGGAVRGGKRVSFADGYQPGQDSDLEEPPIKKRRKPRRAGAAGVAGRAGCAWPCPASHPDHVPLWDALPPPPPPPGDPPRSCGLAVRRARNEPGNILGGFMPPEPPPGLISF